MINEFADDKKMKRTKEMTKIMWVLIAGMMLGKGAQASEANLSSRIKAARLMYETALKQNKANTDCISSAEIVVAAMQKQKKNNQTEALDAYKRGFKIAYGVEKEGKCTQIPDIKAKGFSDRFKQGLEDFPFPKDLTKRYLVSRKGEFLNNIFAKANETRAMGLELVTKILPQDQIDAVINYLESKLTPAQKDTP